MIINALHNNELNSSFQQIKARVEIYKGSTLDRICTCADILHSFSIERSGSSKFFGFGICHKLTATLLDTDREVALSTDNTVEVAFGVEDNFLYPYPIFYVEAPERDAATNSIKFTAYDALYTAAEHRVSELTLKAPYTIRDFAYACAALLGMPIDILVNDGTFDLYFETGANFDGTETIRQALDAIAEATQTIYYLNSDWQLTFKRIDRYGDPVLTIEKDGYFQLLQGESLVLNEICHTTELGDNVSASLSIDGVTQYVRDNPFWELREDLATVLDSAIARMGGLSITQFECDWWGNYLLQIGDKVRLITKDDIAFDSYVLDDTISFEGSVSEMSSWKFDIDTAETDSNPTSLGDALNQTYARVDKVNQTIELVVSKSDETEERVSKIEMDLEGITSTVSEKVQEELNTTNERISIIEQTANDISFSVAEITTIVSDNQEQLSEDLATLTEKVEMKMTSEDVTIAIQSELSNGVDKVKTKVKAYTFDDEGLTIASSENALTTQITENGMTVYDSNADVLTANNAGVQAKNLHANTYLIIGNNSRLQDYGSRTGCFWIGN